MESSKSEHIERTLEKSSKKGGLMKKIELLDTTLRDGEQTEGVSFNPDEKLAITQYLIEKVKIDAVEVTSARISEDEFEAVRKITDWAKSKGQLSKIEVLGFVDGTKSAQWIHDAGGKTINLLTKGSLKHLEGQLRRTPEEHVQDIRAVFDFARSNDMKVNVYLEDWSNGMVDSKEYVLFLISRLRHQALGRVMLADTLGILDPDRTQAYILDVIKKFPGFTFDFHGHNDYDLAIANSIAAAKAGASRLHVTVNGLGERAGNTKMASIAAALKDISNFELDLDERRLGELSTLVESLSGIRSASNTPITGEYVFTQNCGVHADGDKKGNLYQSKLTPERFGRQRRYSLGKTAGLASIDQNLEKLDMDIQLTPGQKVKVLHKIKELAGKKRVITGDDLPYIVADVVGNTSEQKIALLDYEFSLKPGSSPKARVKLDLGGRVEECTSQGDGQYDAFMGAIRDIYSTNDKNLPELIDYFVRIPPGGNTSALVETIITWKKDDKIYKTTGVDSDQLLAAMEATIKMLNVDGF